MFGIFRMSFYLGTAFRLFPCRNVPLRRGRSRNRAYFKMAANYRQTTAERSPKNINFCTGFPSLEKATHLDRSLSWWTEAFPMGQNLGGDFLQALLGTLPTSNMGR